MKRIYTLALYCILLLQADGGWIDRDSPISSLSTTSLVDGSFQKLVFSDEFEVADRSFRDGTDPRWTAMHKDDYTNFALQYYNQDLVSTSNGNLNIKTIVKDISFDINDVLNKEQSKQTKSYQSGMIQGWNKFCFTGGILEISAKLPGKAHVGGLWPAMWLLGNLARATYIGSSNNVWPWSYDVCDSTLQQEQLINKCNIVNHYDLHSKQGRGAPEIDLLEAMPGDEKLINTVAPGSNIDEYRPTPGEAPPLGFWYNKGLEYGPNTSINIFFYGMHLQGKTREASYLADAISANTNLYPSHFDLFHTYRLEWEPFASTSDTASNNSASMGGYIKWYLDDIFLYSINSSTLSRTGSIIPQEPMYIILNTAISSTWGFPAPCPDTCPCDCFDCREEKCACGCPKDMCDNFPAEFQIDYVRVYQREPTTGTGTGASSRGWRYEDRELYGSAHITGCSTPTHPTKTYIKANSEIFMKHGDQQPLLPIVNGGAVCSTVFTQKPASSPITIPSNLDSGIVIAQNDSLIAIDRCGLYGQCINKKCVCNDGYTGPNCKAYFAFDDIDWEPESSIPILPFSFPLPLMIITIIVVMSFFILAAYRFVCEKTGRGGYRMDLMGFNNGYGGYRSISGTSNFGIEMKGSGTGSGMNETYQYPQKK